MRLIGFVLLIAVFTNGVAQNDSKGLKDYYESFFPVGVAISPRDLTGPEAELIKKHFNSITAENVMKMGPIHPEENRFNWEPADQIVAFAQANGMKMRGHTLCWHNQTPDWLFKDAAGNQVSKDVLLQRLKDHITAVVSRYKGKIYAWDVVNEVIDDKDDVFYRPSPWFNIIGEEFIAKAFEYAHAADPDALLFYNDYNTESPVKRAKIIKLVKSLIDAGVPIHGIGLQGHWSIYGPGYKEVDESIKAYSSLGLPLQVTELDISVYKSEQGRREKRADENDTFTPEMELRQVEQYQSIFNVLRENKRVITTVTFWNVTDKRSWLDNFPVRGRKNYPLLFDQELKPKKAYWEVVKFPVRGSGF
ncbi:MAG TPA: endo-1,4-beta-xylanase [Cyclobacteriaceae bacterium]|nr:endo-1,4-beta-xylanase [Cyclobacteriaceae bacterium]